MASSDDPGGEGHRLNDKRNTARRASSWLTRNLAVLSGVSFLQDTSNELLYPILPIFLTTVLGAPVSVVGMIEGLGNGLAAATSPASGTIADRTSRRPLVAAGYACGAVGKLVIALSTTWPMVLVGRSVDRTGKGIRDGPRDALIADSVGRPDRGRAFGFQRAADSAGAVVGPLAGLWGYELLDHRIRPLLWLAVPPALLSTALVFAVHERARPRPDGLPASQLRDDRPAGWRATSPERPLPRPFWRVTMMLTAFGLVNFPDALLLLRLRAIGFSVVAVILAYVTYNVVYSLASYPAGTLSDHMARGRVYGVGLAFFAVGYVGLGLVHDHLLAWVILSTYGAFAACTDGVGKAWVSSLVTQKDQARAQGWFQGLAGGAMLAAGLWAGLTWHGTGVVPLLAAGSVAAIFALYLLVTNEPSVLGQGYEPPPSGSDLPQRAAISRTHRSSGVRRRLRRFRRAR